MTLFNSYRRRRCHMLVTCTICVVTVISFCWILTDRDELYLPPNYKGHYGDTVFLQWLRASSQRCPGVNMLEGALYEVNGDMSRQAAEQTLISFALRTTIQCHKSRLYGSSIDGGWNWCLAPNFLPNRFCVVYSFGIGNDFSFDDAVSQTFGCLVRAFDPSMHQPDFNRSELVHFYNIGLDSLNHISKSGWQMHTLKFILKKFKEDQVVIPYLKFDIELSEWPVLQNVVQDGSLDNVKQVAFEIHVPHYSTVKEMVEYYNIIYDFETLGFRKWFSLRRYGPFRLHFDLVYLNTRFCNEDLQEA